MNVCAAVAVMAFGFVEVSTPQHTAWLDDYGSALQAARLAHRPLLVVIENPNDADQRLDEIDDDDRFASLLQNYELCRVDVTTENGQKIAKSYGATSFPYTAITDSRCQSVVYRAAGKFSADLWERTLGIYSEADSAANSNGEPTVEAELEPFAHADLQTATEAAKQSGRPLLVFVTMPGCYHCVRMKSETYQDRLLQTRITRDFESVIVDQTDEPDWVHDKAVTLFPTTLIVDASGTVITKMPGYVSAHDLSSRLKTLTNHSVSQL